MQKKKILFVCVHNSARSQIAQELLNRKCGEHYEAKSAGLEPGTLNRLAVEVLDEIGIDIAGRTPRSVSEVLASGDDFDYIIAVCNAAESQHCPVIPGSIPLQWSFADPSQFTGTWDDKLEQTRQVRDLISARIDEFCDANCPAEANCR